MGAWGTNTFDNDTACDWTHDLEERDDLSLVEQAIADALAAGDEYLDSDIATQALAACEVIARLKGNFGPSDAYTENVDAWVTAHPEQPSATLVSRGLAAIDRVTTEPSELLELWTEGDDAAAWRSAVADLRRRTAG